MKKLIISTLFFNLILPNLSQAKEKSTDITNSIYFGGEGSMTIPSFYSGGYIGVETNFGNPYVSILNALGSGYMSVEDIAIFRPKEPGTLGINMYYSFGLRVYLGTHYVFMDFNLGISGFTSIPYNKKDSFILFLGTILLGFNIPLSENIDLQISAGGGILSGIGYQIRGGLQFKL